MTTTYVGRIGTGLPEKPTAITTALDIAQRAAKEIKNRESFEARKHIFWFIANQELLKQLRTFHKEHPERQRIEANYGLRIVQAQDRVLVIPHDQTSELATFVSQVAGRNRIAA